MRQSGFSQQSAGLELLQIVTPKYCNPNIFFLIGELVQQLWQYKVGGLQRGGFFKGVELAQEESLSITDGATLSSFNREHILICFVIMLFSISQII